MNNVDPFFSAAALHFQNLFDRYDAPIIILNLVKSKEKTRREAILLEEFTECVSYLNQFLPDSRKMTYIPYDMAKASKSHDHDVVKTPQDIGEQAIQKTSFFCLGSTLQKGIVRTNCIDCLDRTNAAQMIIGKVAFAHQLHTMGIISEPNIAFDTEAINLLNTIYHDLGDTIALQYGGSNLVNTMETYRKISAWSSHSRDMLESLKRYYSNSFTDAEKQDAFNLFLGMFRVDPDKQHIWDLDTDFYLHVKFY